jgi:ubiquinone/menaquinone biosynthesis C-methylase UbiE
VVFLRIVHMQSFSTFSQYFSKKFPARPELKDPEPAYDLWSADYDQQAGNLVLALDEAVFGDLIKSMDLGSARVVDVGCGTGRHWKTILDKNPLQVTGYDVSEGMLSRLQAKFPGANTLHLSGHALSETTDNSTDLIISTLALAHMDHLADVLREWSRILKPGGEILLTDYHPVALERGSKRTFRHDNKLMAVRNFIHPIASIRQLTTQLGIMNCILRSVALTTA